MAIAKDETVNEKELRKQGNRLSNPYEGYLFILPWLLGLLIFQLWPILHSLIVSFCNYNIFEPQRFTGLVNYQEILADQNFWQGLEITNIYVLFTVPLKLAFALLIAMILNQKLKGMGFYRTVYYLPTIVGSSVAIAILWKAFFLKEGVINSLLNLFQISGPSWLGDPRYSLGTVGLLAVWQFGSSMVIFLAGLKQVPVELYESAAVDGANRFCQFLSITLPLLTPMIFFNLVMQMINAFQTFTAPYVIYNGQYGPVQSCMLLVMYIYQQGFQMFRMGYASALAWILLIIIGVFTIVLFKSQKHWVHYTSD